MSGSREGAPGGGGNEAGPRRREIPFRLLEILVAPLLRPFEGILSGPFAHQLVTVWLPFRIPLGECQLFP